MSWRKKKKIEDILSEEQIKDIKDVLEANNCLDLYDEYCDYFIRIRDETRQFGHQQQYKFSFAVLYHFLKDVLKLGVSYSSIKAGLLANSDTKGFFKIYRKIVDTTGKECKISVTQKTCFNKENYVRQKCKELDIDKKLMEKIIEDFKIFIQEYNLSSGLDSLLAGFVYIECYKDDDRRTQTEIANTFNITEVTVRTSYKRILTKTNFFKNLIHTSGGIKVEK